MPELPEVEAARRAVEEHCSGRLIVRASIAEDPKVIEGVEPFSMQQTLVGKRIVAAHRKGKQLWLELDEKPWLCFQFGMAGAVHIKGIQVTKYVRSAVKEDEEWPSKFSKVFLELDNGLEMSFTDKRRFARVRLLDDPAASPPVSELGPDAFLELPREDHFYNIFTKKKMAIKALLLDQSIISGIGNWIADEVLYQARIHPEQSASSLSVEDCKRLLASISEVLLTAIEAGADALKYPKNWIYHAREKKTGEAYIDGKKIEYITVGGRTSAYVPDLQKCSGGPLENANKSARKRSSKKNSVENDDPHDADNGPSMTRAKEAIPGTKARSRSASRRKVAKEEVLPSQVETEVSSEENMKYAQNRTTQQNTSEPTMQVAPAETNRRQKATKSPRRVPTKSAEATKVGSGSHANKNLSTRRKKLDQLDVSEITEYVIEDNLKTSKQRSRAIVSEAKKGEKAAVIAENDEIENKSRGKGSLSNRTKEGNRKRPRVKSESTKEADVSVKKKQNVS
ncbi:hypothetical protein O6H91_17G003400 [Diphasiastrum complanatum]|uniref:Uncharacterized protein n=2 Tax=Diphasiastrum complanatum TaxID=34168 RepID=A0ACC2B3T5_DIPCM|nr:hypothetical protein O6H91_17G003400 [Diphasiastrum complanatum]KAJ7524397.1 hypothetical protein O6H91_17G003400 [Diphasiastrum complanatum]